MLNYRILKEKFDQEPNFGIISEVFRPIKIMYLYQYIPLDKNHFQKSLKLGVAKWLKLDTQFLG